MIPLSLWRTLSLEMAILNRRIALNSAVVARAFIQVEVEYTKPAPCSGCHCGPGPMPLRLNFKLHIEPEGLRLIAAPGGNPSPDRDVGFNEVRGQTRKPPARQIGTPTRRDSRSRPNRPGESGIPSEFPCFPAESGIGDSLPVSRPNRESGERKLGISGSVRGPRRPRGAVQTCSSDSDSEHCESVDLQLGLAWRGRSVSEPRARSLGSRLNGTWATKLNLKFKLNGKHYQCSS
jgi:hypothetical protein